MTPSNPLYISEAKAARHRLASVCLVAWMAFFMTYFHSDQHCLAVFPSIFSEKKGRLYTPTRQLVKWLVVVGLGFGSLLGEAQMYHTSCSGGKMN